MSTCGTAKWHSASMTMLAIAGRAEDRTMFGLPGLAKAVY